MLAHRWAYAFFHPDEDIEGVTIHHKCANSVCVREDHLQAVSHINNVAEMNERQNYLRKIAQLERRGGRVGSPTTRRNMKIRHAGGALCEVPDAYGKALVASAPGEWSQVDEAPPVRRAPRKAAPAPAPVEE